MPHIGPTHTTVPTSIGPTATPVPPDIAVGGAVAHGINGLVGLAIIMLILLVFAFVYWRRHAGSGW